MAPAAVTESEAWFDRYVREHGHDPGEPEPDLGTERRPDRVIRWNGHEVVCEIKEFAQDVIPANQGVGVAGPDRWYGAVRGQVHSAARQMRELANRGLRLVAVLANPRAMFVPLNVDEVISALYGNPQIVMTIDPTTGAAVGRPQWVAGPDGEIRNDHRYLSAVVLLRRVEIPDGEYFRTDVIVSASPDATPLPWDVFDGPRDARWELDQATGAYIKVR